MTQLRAVPTSLAATASLFLFALAPRIVHAESTCATSQDCDKGFECVVVGSGSCPGAPPCAPNADCPAPEPCVVTEEKACVLSHCSSDAQCADGMVCHAWDAPCAQTDCFCPPDQESCNCGPTGCLNETESICTPRYVLPCTSAADCGEGFTCEEAVTETCTATASGGGAAMGSAGAPASSPTPGSAGSSGALPTPDPSTPAPAPEPRMCTLAPTGQFGCVPKAITCDASSDCPTGWLCQQEAPAASAAPGCDGCPEEAKPAPAPLPAPAPRLCRPEYASALDSGGKGSGEVLTSGNPTGSPGGLPPESPQPQNQAGDVAGGHESSACQMGHAPASQSGLSVLAVLGALLGLQRRRRGS